jgi:hypothetical protein
VIAGTNRSITAFISLILDDIYAGNFAERIMTGRLAVALVVVAMALSACGTTQGDRAASGGLIGAAGGAVAGALVGAPLAGAVIGGGVGAVAGAATSPNQVYLGRPAWE